MQHMFRTFVLTRLTPLAALIALLMVGLGIQNVAPVVAANTTYYVDCAGNDANNGTSTSTPWRTMARASQQTYGAGDSILFKRGCTFSGTGFKPVGNGSVASPVTIADYGSGNLPTLDGVGTNEPALLLLNSQNYVVRNLDLTQHGQTPQQIEVEHGKDFDQNSDEYMRAIVHILGLGAPGVINCGEACTVRNITLDSLVVHDGSWNGIYVSGGYYQLDTNTFGYVDNVVVTNVESRNNHKSGVDMTSTYTKTIIYGTTNVKVLNSYLHDNGADGVVFGPVDHGLIDGVHCPFNGLLRNARLGCWSWDSHDVVIQFSESDHNKSPLNTSQARDAGGFDMDLGTEDGVVQYSWSHDNEGEGFLLMTWPIGYGYARGETHNAHMRYNIGERDAKKFGTSVFHFGFTNPALVYNNTIYYESARTAASTMYQAEGGAIGFSKWGKSGVPSSYIYNNIFVANGNVTPGSENNLVRDESGCTCTFDRNLYYRVEGGVRFKWGGTVYTTLAAWQASGRDANGLNANPLFTGAFGGGPAAYHLQSGSPAINAAAPVTVGLRGMGTRDYFGASIPAGGAYDIGAAEGSGTGGPTATPTSTNTPVPPTNTPGGPTNTPTATATPTNTSAPPTATNTPSGGVNLALNKPGSVSSFNSVNQDNTEAVDGNVTTYWRTSKGSALTAEWIVIDLGSSQSISTVKLNWNTYYAINYTVQVSTDNVNWTTKFTTTTGDGGLDTITFASSSARYVKMNSTLWNNSAERIRLNELEIYQ
jgi:hypothetical protein